MDDRGTEGGAAKPVYLIGDEGVLFGLDAGENHLGSVGGNSFAIDVTPVLTVHATYVANDYVGTNNVAMTFAGCARTNGGFGWITRAILIDNVIASVAGELWLFDTAPAGLGLDSAAFTITDADAARCVGVIPFQTYYASVLNSVADGYMPNGPMGFKCLAGSMALYGTFVTRGAPAYVANDLTFRLLGIQD